MQKSIIALVSILILVGLGFAKEMTFIVDDPGGRNVMEFTSKAPIENIVGTTNQVTGRMTFDPENLSQTVKAQLKVDLKSMTTGIKLRDEHMLAENYLNAEVFPAANFEFDGFVQSDVVMLSPGTPAEVTLKGNLTLHGVTHEIKVVGTAAYYQEVLELNSFGYPGDMFNFDGTFTIKLSDFNIKRPEMLIMKLSEEIKIQINFTATTGRTN